MKASCRIASVVFLVLSLPAAALVLTDGLSPEALRVIGKIVTDRRYDPKHPEKFLHALEPTVKLKQQVVAEELLTNLNDFFGWNLPAEGGWPPEEVNDIVYEIVLSPRYDADRFLDGLKQGAPLLRELRSRRCVDRFNEKFGTALPSVGAVPFRQADKLFYDVVARPGFDGDKVIGDLCPATAAAETRDRPAVSQPGSTGTVPAAVETPTGEVRGYGTLFVVLFGGMVAGALLALLARRVARDLRRPARSPTRTG